MQFDFPVQPVASKQEDFYKPLIIKPQQALVINGMKIMSPCPTKDFIKEAKTKQVIDQFDPMGNSVVKEIRDFKIVSNGYELPSEMRVLEKKMSFILNFDQPD